jgi:organic radical activating enzyme
MLNNEQYHPTQKEIGESQLKPNLLKVSGDGTFFTLQGEGDSIGKPTVFLRLHLCNLQCSWCDTRYTWDRTTREFWQESQDWDIDRAISEISVFNQHRLVITGGEPLMQQPMVSRLIKRIPDWDIEIETNGTILPIQDLANRCQFNVSPKLNNSGNKELSRLKPDVLRAYNALSKTTFKFVAQFVDDIHEIDVIVAKCAIDPKKIIIMPEGKSEEEIVNHAIAIIDDVKLRGWRLLPRLQVILWGNKRGI